MPTKAQSRRGKTRTGHYAEQFIKTERNKARRAAKLLRLSLKPSVARRKLERELRRLQKIERRQEAHSRQVQPTIKPV